MKLNEKILITGSNGLVGTALKKKLSLKGYNKVFFSNKQNCNLLNLNDTYKYIKKVKPDYIFHLANLVRGIGGNKSHEFNMLNDNLLINSNIFKAVSLVKIKKFILAGSAAGYSDRYKVNIKESNFTNGEPHLTEREYGYSKRVMLRQAKLLNKETKIKYCYAILNNMYGVNDYFNEKEGHVIPSLIYRCFQSQIQNKDFLVWGSPNAKRCFLNSVDAADILIKLAKQNKYNIVNVSSFKEYKISEVAEIIKNCFNSKQKIKWIDKNISYVKKRSLNTDRLKDLNINEKISLKAGLQQTVNWFLKNYPNIRK